MYAGEIHELDHQVVTIWGKEVHLATLCNGLVDEFLQLCHRGRVGHATLCCHVGNAVHASEPYDILDVNVVANEPLLALVGVDYTNQTFTMLAEVVKERTVLTETVCVGRIVDGRQIVTHQYDET